MKNAIPTMEFLTISEAPTNEELKKFFAITSYVMISIIIKIHIAPAKLNPSESFLMPLSIFNITPKAFTS